MLLFHHSVISNNGGRPENITPVPECKRVETLRYIKLGWEITENFANAQAQLKVKMSYVFRLKHRQRVIYINIYIWYNVRTSRKLCKK